jgi:hypothetical protein
MGLIERGRFVIAPDSDIPAGPFLPVWPESCQNSPEGGLGHLALLHNLPEGNPCLPQLHSHKLFMFGTLFARFWHNCFCAKSKICTMLKLCTTMHMFLCQEQNLYYAKKCEESCLESHQNGLEPDPANTGVPRHHSSSRNLELHLKRGIFQCRVSEFQCQGRQL